MKTTLKGLLHIGFWACYFALAMVMLGIFYGTRENVNDAEIAIAFNIIFWFALVPSAINFYVFYLLLFPKYVLQKRIAKTVSLGILSSLSAAIIGYAGLYFTASDECLSDGATVQGEEHLWIILFIAFIAAISGVIALIIQGFITWFEEIKLKENLRQQNQAMELALIKAKLDPHFLFNTINNIDILILKDQHIASEYLNKLSSIIRFILYETKSDTIPLTKEIEYIEKYIALNKIRTSNQTYVNFEVFGTPDHRAIASMIFIPFIENAFKHNNNKKLQDAINIQIIITEDTVRLRCDNKFDPNRKTDTPHNGLGQTLIRRRLDLLYPEQYLLKIDNQENLYSIDLIINVSKETTSVSASEEKAPILNRDLKPQEFSR